MCDIVRAGLVGAHYAEFVNKLHFKQKKQNWVVEMNLIIVIHFVVSVEMCGWEGVWCVVC